jgi:hypothetical protein
VQRNQWLRGYLLFSRPFFIVLTIHQKTFLAHFWRTIKKTTATTANNSGIKNRLG